MPKKPPPNGYYYFMKYWKAREEKLGRRFYAGMKEVADLASQEWKGLDPHEREYYNKLAKEHRNDPRPNVPKADEKRYNSAGKSFADLERERIEKDQQICKRKECIRNLVYDMSMDELKAHNFYLIHVNFFCKTDHGEYFPAELAISEFSLLNGVQKVFHRFLHPGQIPTGYASEVKDHSDKYHKIPLEFVRGNHKYDTIYMDICEFIKGKYVKNEYPPFFTMFDNLFDNTSMSAVRKTLQRLWQSANYMQFHDEGDWEREFKVFPLSHFFYELKRRCVESDDSGVLTFPNDVMAETELRKDTYHFSSEMACAFHQKEDVIAFCSQSYVIRWANIIRDHCCQHVGIRFDLPGSYVKDTELPHKLVEEEDDFDDCKSTRSGYSTATFYTEKSVDFRSLSGKSTSEKSVDFRSPVGKSSVKSVNLEPYPTPSSSIENSWASAVSQTTKTPSERSWASAGQPKKAPALDNVNFPSLGRGKRMDLANRMSNMNLKK